MTRGLSNSDDDPGIDFSNEELISKLIEADVVRRERDRLVDELASTGKAFSNQAVYIDRLSADFRAYRTETETNINNIKDENANLRKKVVESEDLLKEALFHYSNVLRILEKTTTANDMSSLLSDFNRIDDMNNKLARNDNSRTLIESCLFCVDKDTQLNDLRKELENVRYNVNVSNQSDVGISLSVYQCMRCRKLMEERDSLLSEVVSLTNKKKNAVDLLVEINNKVKTDDGAAERHDIHRSASSRRLSNFKINSPLPSSPIGLGDRKMSISAVSGNSNSLAVIERLQEEKWELERAAASAYDYARGQVDAQVALIDNERQIMLHIIQQLDVDIDRMKFSFGNVKEQKMETDKMLIIVTTERDSLRAELTSTLNELNQVKSNYEKENFHSIKVVELQAQLIEARRLAEDDIRQNKETMIIQRRRFVATQVEMGLRSSRMIALKYGLTAFSMSVLKNRHKNAYIRENRLRMEAEAEAKTISQDFLLDTQQLRRGLVATQVQLCLIFFHSFSSQYAFLKWKSYCKASRIQYKLRSSMELSSDNSKTMSQMELLNRNLTELWRSGAFDIAKIGLEEMRRNDLFQLRIEELEPTISALNIKMSSLEKDCSIKLLSLWLLSSIRRWFESQILRCWGRWRLFTVYNIDHRLKREDRQSLIDANKRREEVLTAALYESKRSGVVLRIRYSLVCWRNFLVSKAWSMWKNFWLFNKKNNEKQIYDDNICNVRTELIKKLLDKTRSHFWTVVLSEAFRFWRMIIVKLRLEADNDRINKLHSIEIDNICEQLLYVKSRGREKTLEFIMRHWKNRSIYSYWHHWLAITRQNSISRQLHSEIQSKDELTEHLEKKLAEIDANGKEHIAKLFLKNLLKLGQLKAFNCWITYVAKKRSMIKEEEQLRHNENLATELHSAKKVGRGKQMNVVINHLRRRKVYIAFNCWVKVIEKLKMDRERTLNSQAVEAEMTALISRLKTAKSHGKHARLLIAVKSIQKSKILKAFNSWCHLMQMCRIEKRNDAEATATKIQLNRLTATLHSAKRESSVRQLDIVLREWRFHGIARAFNSWRLFTTTQQLLHEHDRARREYQTMAKELSAKMKAAKLCGREAQIRLVIERLRNGKLVWGIDVWKRFVGVSRMEKILALEAEAMEADMASLCSKMKASKAQGRDARVNIVIRSMQKSKILKAFNSWTHLWHVRRAERVLEEEKRRNDAEAMAIQSELDHMSDNLRNARRESGVRQVDIVLREWRFHGIAHAFHSWRLFTTTEQLLLKHEREQRESEAAATALSLKLKSAKKDGREKQMKMILSYLRHRELLLAFGEWCKYAVNLRMEKILALEAEAMEADMASLCSKMKASKAQGRDARVNIVIRSMQKSKILKAFNSWTHLWHVRRAERVLEEEKRRKDAEAMAIQSELDHMSDNLRNARRESGLRQMDIVLREWRFHGIARAFHLWRISVHAELVLRERSEVSALVQAEIGRCRREATEALRRHRLDSIAVVINHWQHGRVSVAFHHWCCVVSYEIHSRQQIALLKQVEITVDKVNRDIAVMKQRYQNAVVHISIGLIRHSNLLSTFHIWRTRIICVRNSRQEVERAIQLTKEHVIEQKQHEYEVLLNEIIENNSDRFVKMVRKSLNKFLLQRYYRYWVLDMYGGRIRSLKAQCALETQAAIESIENSQDAEIEALRGRLTEVSKSKSLKHCRSMLLSFVEQGLHRYWNIWKSFSYKSRQRRVYDEKIEKLNNFLILSQESSVILSINLQLKIFIKLTCLNLYLYGFRTWRENFILCKKEESEKKDRRARERLLQTMTDETETVVSGVYSRAKRIMSAYELRVEKQYGRYNKFLLSIGFQLWLGFIKESQSQKEALRNLDELIDSVQLIRLDRDRMAASVTASQNQVENLRVAMSVWAFKVQKLHQYFCRWRNFVADCHIRLSNHQKELEIQTIQEKIEKESNALKFQVASEVSQLQNYAYFNKLSLYRLACQHLMISRSRQKCVRAFFKWRCYSQNQRMHKQKKEFECNGMRESVGMLLEGQRKEHLHRCIFRWRRWTDNSIFNRLKLKINEDNNIKYNCILSEIKAQKLKVSSLLGRLLLNQFRHVLRLFRLHTVASCFQLWYSFHCQSKTMKMEQLAQSTMDEARMSMTVAKDAIHASYEEAKQLTSSIRSTRHCVIQLCIVKHSRLLKVLYWAEWKSYVQERIFHSSSENENILIKDENSKLMGLLENTEIKIGVMKEESRVALGRHTAHTAIITLLYKLKHRAMWIWKLSMKNNVMDCQRVIHNLTRQNDEAVFLHRNNALRQHSRSLKLKLFHVCVVALKRIYLAYGFHVFATSRMARRYENELQHKISSSLITTATFSEQVDKWRAKLIVLRFKSIGVLTNSSIRRRLVPAFYYWISLIANRNTIKQVNATMATVQQLCNDTMSEFDLLHSRKIDAFIKEKKNLKKVEVQRGVIEYGRRLMHRAWFLWLAYCSVIISDKKMVVTKMMSVTAEKDLKNDISLLSMNLRYEKAESLFAIKCLRCISQGFYWWKLTAFSLARQRSLIQEANALNEALSRVTNEQTSALVACRHDLQSAVSQLLACSKAKEEADIRADAALSTVNHLEKDIQKLEVDREVLLSELQESSKTENKLLRQKLKHVEAQMSVLEQDLWDQRRHSAVLEDKARALKQCLVDAGLLGTVPSTPRRQ